jgi:hypothetical protein
MYPDLKAGTRDRGAPLMARCWKAGRAAAHAPLEHNPAECTHNTPRRGRRTIYVGRRGASAPTVERRSNDSGGRAPSAASSGARFPRGAGRDRSPRAARPVTGARGAARRWRHCACPQQHQWRRGRRRLPQSSREAELCSSSLPSMAAWRSMGGADRPADRTLGASRAGNAVKVRERGGVVCLSRYLSSDEYSNVVS